MTGSGLDGWLPVAATSSTTSRRSSSDGRKRRYGRTPTASAQLDGSRVPDSGWRVRLALAGREIDYCLGQLVGVAWHPRAHGNDPLARSEFWLRRAGAGRGLKGIGPCDRTPPACPLTRVAKGRAGRVFAVQSDRGTTFAWQRIASLRPDRS